MSVTPERWARLEPHLDTLLDLPDGEERTAYLDALPAADRELRTDLERLLSYAGGETLSSLATRAPDLLGAAVEGEDPALGRTLGAYRLLERIGSGGMGVVYRAERSDEAYVQEVAVKVLPWHAGREAARRFRVERETLARLQHENVTRILDGGVTPDGLSYLVMELVRGEPITDFVRNHGWRVRERVRLFLDVGEAVHAAHQRLIVHRDLKPANVLVTNDGQVKVLDFGIAKWLDEESIPGAASLTRTGDRVLTPQYASPEQFRGEELTTASDVYSLGVLLYELIADAPPYELEGKTPTEQDRLICEVPPPSPAGRSEESRLVTGDLERVVLKALRKEPTRRYASAEALADDLRAWLEGKPVSATPDSRRYRFRRFVARNRAGVIAGTAVAVVLVAGLVGTAWQAGVASRERDRAQAEARHAREVSDFLVEAMEQANPWASGGEVTLTDLLDQAVTRVETDLADQPEMQVALYTTMGKVYGHTNKKEAGARLLARGLAIEDSLHGPGTVDACRLLYHLARNLHAEQPDSAIALMWEAESYLQAPESPEARLMRSSVLEDLASWVSVEDIDRGLALSRESLDIRMDLLEEPDEYLARSYHSHASMLSAANSPEAGAWFARAAKEWRETLGDPHLNLASTLNNWAIWCSRHDRPDSAAILYRESIAMSEGILGKDDPSVMTARINFAGFLQEQERYAESEEMLRAAIEVLVPSEGGSMRTAAAWANLGHARYYQGDYAGADEYYDEARRIFAGTFGETHLYAAAMDLYLARNDWRTGRFPAGERRFDDAFAILAAAHPAGARREAEARVWSGRLHLESGDLDRAETDLRRALVLTHEQFPEGHWQRAEARAALGAVLVARGETDEGLRLLREGHEGLVTARGAEHPMTQWAAEERTRAEGGA